MDRLDLKQTVQIRDQWGPERSNKPVNRLVLDITLPSNSQRVTEQLLIGVYIIIKKMNEYSMNMLLFIDFMLEKHIIKTIAEKYFLK